jgi:Uma2 family endonuclease
MADAPAITVITEDDLLRLNADEFVEIVDGEIVKMTPNGFMHIIVSANVYDILRAYVKKHGLGYVAHDGLIYILEKKGKKVIVSHVPDVSFIRKGKIPEFDYSKPFPGAPDLAVEVISPSEGEDITLDKIRDYFKYGTEQVWVIYPNQKEVHVYLRDDLKIIRVYNEDDMLEAESLFPGLKIAVRDFFELPE